MYIAELHRERSASSSPYAAHQAIWTVYGDDPDRDRDFLFRAMDPVGRRFLAVSDRPPADAPGWRVTHKPYAPDLRRGDRLAFSLRANPTRTVTDAHGTKRRVDVVMHAKTELKAAGLPREEWPLVNVLAHEAGKAWLLQRAPGLGLGILESTLRVDGHRRHEFVKPKTNSGKVTIAGLDFNGLADVTDPEALTRALFQGVGRAKAFGFGLLLVRRA